MAIDHQMIPGTVCDNERLKRHFKCDPGYLCSDQEKWLNPPTE